MAVDWTKPIEAVEKETGRVVSMTFKEFDTDSQPLTEDDPRFMNGIRHGCWRMDGSDWFGGDIWSVRNVKPQGRTFSQDWRESNPELHQLYVNTALDILETVGDALVRLDDFSNWNASQFATELRKTRAKLVKEDAAFFEAAALSYAGKDWVDAVE